MPDAEHRTILGLYAHRKRMQDSIAIYRTIFSFLRELRRLRQREMWTRPAIEAHQAHALAELRRHAYAHSPFYRRFHAGHQHSPLHELPVLTKQLLNDHFDEIATDRAIRHDAVAMHVRNICAAERFLDRYVVVATSGTTGNPGHILYDRAAWGTVLASLNRYEARFASLRGALRRPRIAIVASETPWHMSARVSATVRSRLLPILRLDVGDPLDSIVARLNEWQPNVLATYASMAGILADEQTAGRLRIAPDRILCSAEVLTRELRHRVESVWGQIVFNQYGATEGGALATECEHHNGLHIFEDLVILEVVDEDYRPVPPGVYGDKVLLTVLFNHTQPLIRYEISDSLCLAAATPCPCGRAYARIEDIQGRLEETLRFPARSGGTVTVHPMLFYRILDAAPVAGWRVVQGQDGLALCLTGRPDSFDEAALIHKVRHALEQAGAEPPPIRVQWQGIVRGATGKASRIVSELPGPTPTGKVLNGVVASGAVSCVTA